MANFENKMSYK